MNKLKKIWLTIWCIITLLISFFMIVEWISFDRAFYQKQYRLLGISENIGTSEKDLVLMTDTLLDYLQEKRSDLHVKIHVHQQEREAYNAREIAHMYDVKTLYQGMKVFRNVFLFLSIISCLYFLIKDRFYFFDNIVISAKRAGYFLLSVLAASGVVILNDFDSFWIHFHQIFFRNDLWLLDPRTDLLISLVPQAFFSAMVWRIFFYFFVVVMIAIVIIWNIARRKYE